MQRNGSVEQREPFFMDLFYQVPSDAKVFRNGANCAKLQKIQNSKGKGSDVAVFPVHKWQRWPPEMTAALALEPVQQKVEEASFPSHMPHPEKSVFLAFEGGLSVAAFRAFHVLVRHCATDENAIPKVAGCFIVDTSNPKSMVKYGRGHGLISPPVVRLQSNNWGSCHVHFFFSRLGTHLTDEPQMSGISKSTLYKYIAVHREEKSHP